MGSNGNENENSVLYRLYNSFIQHEYPYISIVDGGYMACHEYAIQHNLKIESHNTKKCVSCNGENKEAIESTLDKFFKFGPISRTQSHEITSSYDYITNEKMFKCKLSEKISFEQSGLGLVVSPSQIILYDISRKEVTDFFYISKLIKITSNKTKQEVLSFSFNDSEKKKIFIIDPKDVKEFLARVRVSFQSMKQASLNLKK